jgi:hypothetical protein
MEAECVDGCVRRCLYAVDAGEASVDRLPSSAQDQTDTGTVESGLAKIQHSTMLVFKIQHDMPQIIVFNRNVNFNRYYRGAVIQ